MTKNLQITEEDILKELSENEAENYLKILKNFLPKYIHSHHYLYNYIRYLKRLKTFETDEENEISDRCRIKIYGYRYGKPENCTFIGVSGIKDYWLLFFTCQESGEELMKCVQQTNLINWNIRPISGVIQETFYEKLDKIFKEKKLYIKNYCLDTIFYKDKESSKEFILNVPNNLYLAPLEVHHSKIINDNWSHRYENSLKYIESCIKLNGGTGLFKSDTKELIAWDMFSENYSSGFLYTVESERRKGYGKLVLKAECKRIAIKDDLDIFGYVIHGNFASEHLTRGIGFESINPLVWFEQEN